MIRNLRGKWYVWSQMVWFCLSLQFWKLESLIHFQSTYNVCLRPLPFQSTNTANTVTNLPLSDPPTQLTRSPTYHFPIHSHIVKGYTIIIKYKTFAFLYSIFKWLREKKIVKLPPLYFCIVFNNKYKLKSSTI